MKKIIQLRRIAWLPAISTAIAVLAGGCATPEQHSFNHDFGEQFPVNPMYSIQTMDAMHFRITVHQGKPSTGTERVINLKNAASTIAKAESQRLGWEKWQVDYIREYEQGWMHVVVAEVTREKYIAPTFPGAGGNP